MVAERLKLKRIDKKKSEGPEKFARPTEEEKDGFNQDLERSRGENPDTATTLSK